MESSGATVEIIFIFSMDFGDHATALFHAVIRFAYHQ